MTIIKSRTAHAVGLVAAGSTALLLTAGSSGALASSCTATWQSVRSDVNQAQALYSLPPSVSAGQTHVAATTEDAYGYRTPVYSYQGGRLTRMPTLPSTPSTREVSWSGPMSFDSTADGWIGQQHPFVFGGGDFLLDHWSGGRWTQTPPAVAAEPAHQGLLFRSLQAFDAHDAWAVGYTYLGKVGIPAGRVPLGAMTQHWDGTQWTLVPNPLDGTAAALEGTAARGPDDLYAAGVQTLASGRLAPLVEHWDGSTWSTQALPALPGDAKLLSISEDAVGDVWAAGEQAVAGVANPVPLLLHLQAGHWSTVKIPRYAGLYSLDSIYADSPGDVWAMGSYTGGALTGLIHLGAAGVQQVMLPRQQNASAIDYFPGGVGGTSAQDVWAAVSIQPESYDAPTTQFAHLSCSGG